MTLKPITMHIHNARKDPITRQVHDPPCRRTGNQPVSNGQRFLRQPFRMQNLGPDKVNR